MIKTLKKCLYCDAGCIVVFDENDEYLGNTKSKSSKRLYLGLLKLLNKFGYLGTVNYQICMNSDLILKQGECDRREIVETLFEKEYTGDGIIQFAS